MKNNYNRGRWRKINAVKTIICLRTVEHPRRGAAGVRGSARPFEGNNMVQSYIICSILIVLMIIYIAMMNDGGDGWGNV